MCFAGMLREVFKGQGSMGPAHVAVAITIGLNTNLRTHCKAEPG